MGTRDPRDLALTRLSHAEVDLSNAALFVRRWPELEQAVRAAQTALHEAIGAVNRNVDPAASR